jgi:hypothetical protein
LPAAFARLRAAANAHAIDTLWTPAYEGAHPDHDCVNALAFALTRERSGMAAWEFAEYSNVGGIRRANDFVDAGSRGDGTTTIATEDESEIRWKAGLLGLYRSEGFNLRNVGAGTGKAGAVRLHESFRPLPRHDYARPPHPGTLFYERFHWVPFPVPQIDRTTGAEVSAAITAFLAGTQPAA